MSGQSSVGQHGVYEAGDQRNYKDSEEKKMNSDPYHEGKEHSHKNLDSKDERSIANKLAAAEKEDGPKDSAEVAQSKRDPTLPAQMHGNEPSKGAKVDAELQAEDEQRLREKQGK